MCSVLLRRALLATGLLVTAGCHKAQFPPAGLGETRALDKELLDLVESKAAIVRADPSNARAHATLGLVYQANNLWEPAEESFAHAMALDEKQPVYQYYHAIVLLGIGRTQEAVAQMREAATRMPNDAGVQQRVGLQLIDVGDLDGARRMLERALVLVPSRSETLASMARLELAWEHWDKSLQFAQRALAADPTSQSAAYTAGLALTSLGREDEARNFLAAGRGAHPSWLEDPLTREMLSYKITTNVLVEEASHSFAVRDYARAAQLYEKLVARQPGDLGQLNNLAASLIELGKIDRAEQVLKTAETVAPDSFAVQLNLAEVHLRRNEVDLARPHAESAVALGGSIGSTHFMLARVLATQNDIDGSYRELKKAVELDTRNPQMFVALTELSIQRKQIEEARIWCRKALEIDPSLLPARVNQCALALRMNDLEDARNALAVLEKQAPTNPRTVALRAEIEKREH